jgi:hypothetical protein
MTDENDMTDEKRTLGEMSHTNPYTGEVFGSTQTYSRGNTVAADGGEANEVNRTDADGENGDDETLADVDHTPDDDVDGAQGTFDRGEEATATDGSDDE